jgi:hypothetical protein
MSRPAVALGMLQYWAAGLTVSTTGLTKDEKQRVKNIVEAAGGT